jgi:tagatose-6-phosphate ketose/aldose isomerase
VIVYNASEEMRDIMFNFTKEELLTKQAYWTAQEIYQQPVTWLKTLTMIEDQWDAIQKFIAPVVSASDYDVVFTGAGTSEFAGNVLYAALNRKYGYHVHSFATTDLVSSPRLYLAKDKPTLLISFGRSGNSPESVAAVKLADQVCEQLYHLVITCNEQGQLVEWSKAHARAYTITLAPETHDQSFAMTSSFTNMILAAYLALSDIHWLKPLVVHYAECAQQLLDQQDQLIRQVIDYGFQRIVYLGSNVLKGIAQESALKILELTAGNVATMFDSPLGFRHGPKSIINDQTLTVLYLCDHQYGRQYEVDLLKEMSGQRKGNKIFLVGSQLDELSKLADWSLELGYDGDDEVLGGLVKVCVAQMLALFKSLCLGITSDNPCPSGEVNRVVQGVTVYPYEKEQG